MKASLNENIVLFTCPKCALLHVLPESLYDGKGAVIRLLKKGDKHFAQLESMIIEVKHTGVMHTLETYLTALRIEFAVQADNEVKVNPTAEGDTGIDHAAAENLKLVDDANVLEVRPLPAWARVSDPEQQMGMVLAWHQSENVRIQTLATIQHVGPTFSSLKLEIESLQNGLCGKASSTSVKDLAGQISEMQSKLTTLSASLNAITRHA